MIIILYYRNSKYLSIIILVAAGTGYTDVVLVQFDVKDEPYFLSLATEQDVIGYCIFDIN